MPDYRIAFETSNPNTMRMPADLLKSGGVYLIEEGPSRGVQIRGNKEGLLYLAEVLVRAAIGGHSEDFHVHLPMFSDDGGPNIDGRPELTIFAAQPRSSLANET